MKRIAVCLDGTWQTLRQERKTNINIIARSVAHSIENVQQIVIYKPGVGSTVNALKGEQRGTFAGGVFGQGLEELVLNTYVELCFNYEPGDEIYLFGFSRGAYAARSLGGLIGKCGILSRRFAEKAQDAFDMYRDKEIDAASQTAVDFRTKFGKRLTKDGVRVHADHRPTIKYMGVFDTVGQRGVPSMLGPISDLMNKRFAFHSLTLGNHVLAARHAVAIDERRAAFPPTLWENLGQLNADVGASGYDAPYQQRWFVGVHGDVGGGSVSNLSAFPLDWIVRGAERAGLVMDRSAASPLSEALRPEGLDPGHPISKTRGLQVLHPVNWVGKWRRITTEPTVTRADAEQVFHPSVPLRTAARGMKKPYSPPPLRPYADAIRELAGPAVLIVALIALVSPPAKRSWLARLFGR